MAAALSQQRTAHALRHFTIIGALWGIYTPNVFVTSSIFTGYALSLGIRESQIAFLAAVTGLVGASQAVSAYWTRRVRNKRRLAVAMGISDFTCASSIIVCLVVPQGFRFPVLAVLLFAAYTLGNTVSPIFVNWMANVIPEGLRATYTARRMFVLTLVSAAYLFVASRWLDLSSDPVRFVVVYLFGWVAGILGYVLLALTPYPSIEVEEAGGYGRSVLAPLRQRPFAMLAAFMGSWTLAMSVAAPFYAVYMLRYLELTYTRIAVYTSLSLGAMLVGYRIAGALAEQFGCKPIIKILIIPAVLVPLLWTVTGPATWAVLIPVACAISGFAIAGIQVAGSALLYKIVPAGRDNSLSFAILTSFTALGTFSGAMLGGTLKGQLGEGAVPVGPMSLSPPQLVFLISSALYVVPVVLSHLLSEPEAETAVEVLGKFRGNIIGLAYNYVLYNLAREARTRATALRGMARSRSPLAVRRLSEGLDDASPEVRHEAALGLGEAKARDAVPELLARLTDEASDIRSEAAEALGQIGDPDAIEPLRRALNEGDARLRCSAALALGEIASPEACDLLIDALNGSFDRAAFPAFVDAAGRAGDLRTAAGGLAGLPHYDSPVIRMQIINGVCRALGEKNHFYKLVSRRGLDRSSMVEPMMRRIVRLLRRTPGVEDQTRDALADEARAVAEAITDDQHEAMAQHARALAERAAQLSNAGDVAKAGAAAIVAYVDQVPAARLGDEGTVFVVIALTSLARHLGREAPVEEPMR